MLRWMRRAPRRPEPAKRWATFLNNHREAIAAMDFYTVPTLTFGVLYCFFVIAHDRRRILHWNVTRHPTSAWVKVRNGEKVHGCDHFAMVAQECRPSLRRIGAPRCFLHPAQYGSFGDIEAENLEFAVDAGRAPCRIFGHHSENKPA